jgi:acyl-CoA reductase-like NAD-dependent aldehyde dehydrogenase
MLIHESKYEEVKAKLIKVYGTICIGDPLDSKTLCGPLHSDMSLKIYEDGI